MIPPFKWSGDHHLGIILYLGLPVSQHKNHVSSPSPLSRRKKVVDVREKRFMRWDV
jgi:hypothetical protein